MKYYIVGIYRFLVKILAIPKLFDKESNLTSNIAVNKLLSPFYFIFILYYLKTKGIPFFSQSSYFVGALPFAIFSTFFYVWCSYFFQPDLDVRLNRPGMNSFPFGAIFMNSSVGFILSPIQAFVGKIWYYFWQPYAELCTHRGVSHWPIVSVFYRVTYIYFWLIILENILAYFGLGDFIVIRALDYWARSFYPWSNTFGNITWFVFCFPVFVSDTAHEFIDYVDSKRKGISYCPPQIARGYFAKVFELTKKIISKK